MGASDLALRSAGLANIHRLAPHLVGDLPLSPAELPPPVLFVHPFGLLHASFRPRCCACPRS